MYPLRFLTNPPGAPWGTLTLGWEPLFCDLSNFCFLFSSFCLFYYFIIIIFRFVYLSLCLGYMPPPAPLLDDSKYVSLPRQQQQHYGQSQSSRPSQHHHLHRPYSFTSGMLPDNPGQNLGSNFCWISHWLLKF